MHAVGNSKQNFGPRSSGFLQDVGICGILSATIVDEFLGWMRDY